MRVRLTPRAARDEIVGVAPNGTLLVRVRAAPVDGAANQALIQLMAKAMEVPRTSISVVRGHSSRDKTVSIEGDSGSAIVARWPGVLTT
ncbi:MAG TPA: DUF167 domain-containing protein [Candidatus Limnocylindrales bacterium]|nr:DUF167 domain-containing protein [Candidatus Limnocylindrales bacterium]